MHAVEELVEPPYLYADWVNYRVRLTDGTENTMRVRRHGFNGWQQRYDRIGAVLAGDGIRSGLVLSPPCHLLEAPVFWHAALATLKENPLFFVDRTTSAAGEGANREN